MALRTWVGNSFLNVGRKLARADGRELAVDLSDHSISIAMVDPEADGVAWDDNLYRYGNVFMRGYANPIKPKVNRNKALEDPDEVDVDVSEEAEIEKPHVEMMSSERYAMFMIQHLISQLLNPTEQWRYILYAVIGVAILQFVSIIITMYVAGGF